MMKNLELFLNVIHYCLYKLDYKLHLLSNKVNPFLLLGKIPAIKRKFEERGVTQVEVVNKVWGDKRYGFSIMISGGALAIIVFFIFWAMFLVLNNLLNHPFNFSLLSFTVCMTIAYSLCHVLVFQKDKYILYFRQFDKWSNEMKWKYCSIAFLFILGSIVAFIYSFRFLESP